MDDGNQQGLMTGIGRHDTGSMRSQRGNAEYHNTSG